MRRTALVWRRGETDLIIHNHVQCAVYCVSAQLAHVERLLNNPLPGETRVAVNQYAHAMFALRIIRAVLLGTNTPKRHWIDELEMTRIEAKREMNLGPG